MDAQLLDKLGLDAVLREEHEEVHDGLRDEVHEILPNDIVVRRHEGSAGRHTAARSGTRTTHARTRANGSSAGDGGGAEWRRGV